MKIGEKEWEKLMDDLVLKHEPGELIPHDYLKKVFHIAEPDFDEFESQTEFVEAISLVQFEYMSLVDKLRYDILEKHKLYMRNIRGDGYIFLPPQEQTDFAKSQALDGVRKELRRGVMILKNIRFSALSQDEKRQNADELAKLGQLQQLMKAF